MIARLGLKPNLYHCNEGHAAFIGLERLRRLSEVKLFKFEESLEVVKASTLFTTHTPVPAGHDSFNEDLMRTYMGHYPGRLNISWNEFIGLGRLDPANSSEKFSMSYLASRLSQEINAVSKLHGEVTRNMFKSLWKGYFPQELHVGYVTNGVHYRSWTSREWQKLHVKVFGENFIENTSDPSMWENINNVTDDEVWSIKQGQRSKLITYIRQRLHKNAIRRHESPGHIIKVIDSLDDQTLTIGFARRFATYKRANLIFKDLDRLASIINRKEMPVQFIFAGKAHPRDKAGQDLIKHIIEISRRPEFIGKLIFLEDYDMTVARQLVQGVDIWLNTPTRPLEASGTSGMKAAMNGVMNFSVLDGWWVEGYREGAGWALPEERVYADQEFQNELDAATIYNILENELVPMFYRRDASGIPIEWITYIKNTFSQVAPHFTTRRMIDDYISRFYNQLENRASDIRVNNYHMARVITRWKNRVAASWDKINVLEVQYSNKLEEGMKIGEKYFICVKLDIDGLEPDDIGVELIVTRKKTDPDHEFVYKKEFTRVKVEGQEVTYKLKSIPTQPGNFLMGIRIFPSSNLLPHRQDFSYMRWI
jgi:alpha-glucan phosphorylase-like protein